MKLKDAVRNHKGEVLLAASKRENLSMDPSLAEALGIRWGLQLAKEQQLNKVIIESDAAGVVNCINDKCCMATIDPFIQDCKLLLQHFQNSVICHIRRQANVAAHGMVKEAKILGSRTWLGNAPSQIQSFICTDAMFIN